ncbi:unnamed protein product [Coffea canephora]|uniref:RRM domain-containing protein n=1 Tax=Coffea canephora TaxID=49390 RepID=A0A068UK52_COFCA|nr:unnamed protein product [Coffea canephora]
MKSSILMINFDDYRDADDAIRGRDGYNFDGHRLWVELTHGRRGSSSSYDLYSSYSSGGSRGGVSRRSDYCVLVTGLPPSASWQDLKARILDFLTGDVCFSQVFRDRDGELSNIFSIWKKFVCLFNMKSLLQISVGSSVTGFVFQHLL